MRGLALSVRVLDIWSLSLIKGQRNGMGRVRHGLIREVFSRREMTQVNDRSLKLKDLFSVMVCCNKRT